MFVCCLHRICAGFKQTVSVLTLTWIFIPSEELDLGDVVYAARPIIDDGGMPDSEEGILLAEAGARGVIVMKGYVEEDPGRSVFLVRFEDQDLNLGPPIGCWVEDLTVPTVE